MKCTYLQLALTIAITFILSGCSQNPATWDADKIGSWIEKEWDLATVTVTEHENGSFSGDGTDRNGTSYVFKVEQKPETRELVDIPASFHESYT